MGSTARRAGRPSAVALAGWIAMTALLVVTFFAALASLNRTIYGAATFVERYLSAIANDDLATAATTPGVQLDDEELAALGLAPEVSTAMLRSGVIAAGPEDVRITGDEVRDDGVHEVTASYRLETAIVETTFEVRPIEPLYGILSRWAFATSPMAVLDVTAEHSPLFQVGDLELDTRALKTGDELAAFRQTTPYLAIAPAVYTLGYDSTLLAAPPVTVPVEAAARVPVTVSSQATETFVQRVQTKVDEFLYEQCAPQQVLQPTGCPFGIVVDDRVVSTPTWSIVQSPVVTLVPGETAFEMPPTEGIAHIVVEARSLFDGELYTIDQDEPFEMSLTASVRPDGSIAIQLR